MYKVQSRVVSKTTGKPSGWKDCTNRFGVQKFATESDARAYAASFDECGIFDAANFRVVLL